MEGGPLAYGGPKHRVLVNEVQQWVKDYYIESIGVDLGNRCQLTPHWLLVSK